MNMLFKAIGLALVTVIVAACGTNINIENGELVVNSSFSLSEEVLNSGESTALNLGDVNVIENATFDIQDGQIVISGDVLCESDSRQEGSITLDIAASEDGFIDVEISNIESDCDGVESSLITQAQDQMADSLAEAASALEESDATLTFTEVTLADDSITIAFEVRAPLNGQ